jgi:hypothetical protein
MKLSPVILLAAGVALAGCGKKAAPTSANQPARGKYSSGNPLTAPVDYLGAVDQGKNTAEAVAATAPLNHAVQEFFAGEGRYPKSLKELVTQGYLPKLPQAPYGRELVYNTNTHHVSVVRKPQPAPAAQNQGK